VQPIRSTQLNKVIWTRTVNTVTDSLTSHVQAMQAI
jgi:hypothetical protein